jgi:hypothetical protein
VTANEPISDVASMAANIETEIEIIKNLITKQTHSCKGEFILNNKLMVWPGS